MQGNTQFWDELAIQSYKAILKTKPNEGLVHKNLGLAYVRTGKLNKAARSFERATKCEEDSSEAYYHLGTTYQKLGKVKEARRAFNKYQKLNGAGKKDTPVVAKLLEELNADATSA